LPPPITYTDGKDTPLLTMLWVM